MTTHEAYLEEMAGNCRLCPRRCGVDRARGEAGWCGGGGAPRVFLSYVHWGEAEELCPTRAVYLSGCNWSCRFCSTAEDRARLPARPLTAEYWRELLRTGEAEKVRSVNLLGGEPLIHLPALSALMRRHGSAGRALVWKTNLYGAAEAVAALADGLTGGDVVMGDLKFGSAECAAGLAGAADGVSVPRERARQLFAAVPERLIVRHLALPGHFDCCTRPVLEWIAKALPGARLDLRADYMPPAACRGRPPLNRMSRADEIARLEELADDLGLRRVVLARAGREPAPEAGDGPVTAEFAVSPEGIIMVRHSVTAAVEAVRAAAAPSGDVPG